jgi:hypothetical protein
MTENRLLRSIDDLTQALQEKEETIAVLSEQHAITLERLFQDFLVSYRTVLIAVTTETVAAFACVYCLSLCLVVGFSWCWSHCWWVVSLFVCWLVCLFACWFACLLLLLLSLLAAVAVLALLLTCPLCGGVQELDEVHREALVRKMLHVMPEAIGSVGRFLLSIAPKEQALVIMRDSLVDREEVRPRRAHR